MIKNSDKKRWKLLRKLTNKYRMVLLNEDTYEEVGTMRLTRLNLFTFAGIVVILLVAIVYSLVAFTDIRELIPGYPDAAMRQHIRSNAMKLDSLEYEQSIRDQYFDNLNRIIAGEAPENFMNDTTGVSNQQEIAFHRSANDSLLRRQVEAEEQFRLNVLEDQNGNLNLYNMHFFTPVTGIVTREFDPIAGHYGIDLVAVSKTKSPDQILEAYHSGHKHFGENKIQELVGKHDKLPKDIKWHMIGHLQTNKVAKAVKLFDMIHSIDSLNLAEEINKRAGNIEKRIDCLIEVNSSGESAKYGFDIKETLSAVRTIEKMDNIHLRGLMTIGPHTDDAEEIVLSELSDDKLVEQMHDDLYDGLKEEIEEGTTILLNRGWTADKVLNVALVEGMRIVGIDFRDGILFVPEVLLSANAMKGGMALLKPLLAETGIKPIGKMVIGTVKGDIHDIGKNLVVMMMEGAGFEVIDIGINNAVQDYFAALEEHKPDILGMSALLTTTMPYMKVVIDEMVASGIRDDYIVLVGGAPLNEEFGAAVGADAYCRDAAQTAETGPRLIRERREASAGA